MRFESGKILILLRTLLEFLRYQHFMLFIMSNKSDNNIPNDDNNSRLLKDFENHWDRICKKIEATEMSMADVRSWDNKFELDRLKLIRKLPGHSFTLDADTRINRIKDKIDIAVLKAKANYREKEKIRLKDSYYSSAIN